MVSEFIPTLPLGEAPGPETSADVRRTWYGKVNDWKACRNYDEARAHCYWCLSDDDQPFTDKNNRRGVYKYCSERCRDAMAAPRQMEHKN